PPPKPPGRVPRPPQRNRRVSASRDGTPGGRRAAAGRRRRVGPEFLGTRVAVRLKLDSESHGRPGLFPLGLLHDAAHLYTTGMEHSPTSATGTAWERTAWHATLRAA